MKKIILVAAMVCGFSTATLANPSFQAAAPATITTSLDSEPSVKDRTRQLAVNSRKRKSPQQFEASLRKTYPQSYQLVRQLGDEDKEDIYSAYKAGDPMGDIRRQVIKKYAALAKQ